MIVKNNSVHLETVGEGVQRKILATGGKMMAVEVHFKKGAVGTVHTHPHEQISYIVSGSFEFEMDGKKEILKAGDTYYVAPNAAHGVVALEDSMIVDIFTPQREDFLK
ncbi:MAG: cupin domain-containing protein [Epulopiscium sp.]|nr:cupin domain-containing protein [Candidatus Epulonipiscium sp.]